MTTETASLIVAGIAMFASVYSSITSKRSADIAQKELEKHSEPMLSFTLFTKGGLIYLKVKNTGSNPASKINLKIIAQEGNFGQSISFGNILSSEDLYLNPEEEISECIGINGSSCDNLAYPKIKLKIDYTNPNNNKENEDKERWIYNIDVPEENKELIRLLKSVNENFQTIALSENRIANYLEGRTLFQCDHGNFIPNGSLYQDMRDAFNDKDIKYIKTPEEFKKYWENKQKEKFKCIFE